MSNVVELKSFKARREGWIELVCRSCGHHWEAPVPTPMSAFRCRECNGDGQYRHIQDDDVRYVCECGGGQFQVFKSGAVECCDCGCVAPFNAVAWALSGG